MGQLIDGEWHSNLADPRFRDGRFRRADAVFRNWITPDGRPGPSGEGGFPAESGRYHLYVSYACPWAHRTLIFRALKGLAEHISVDVVHPDMLEMGWSFTTDFPGASGDSLFGAEFLHQIYQKDRPGVTSRASVPVLWDKARGRIVSNESSEIIRMFNSAFDAITGNDRDFWPEALREAIEPINARIYSGLNNGVYKAGFARSQAAYDEAATGVFDTLDWLEDHLSHNRYLMGETLTEADWRLFPTLMRFDLVYHTHFKCNRKWLREYPMLWAYTRALYQMPGISGTTDFAHVVRHYHYSHDTINPYRIVPVNPLIDWDEPHGRG